MFTSGDNISRAVIHMLKAGIEEKYQMSNLTGVKGWHNAMTVGKILTQLETNYGRPDPSAIQANETKWNAPHSPTDSPESLFHKMEQCQEVVMLADNPYTKKQIITKTVEHLKRSGMFPTKEYEDWEAVTAKTCTCFSKSTSTKRHLASRRHSEWGHIGSAWIRQRESVWCVDDNRGVGEQ
jgi:hypothetical protein